LVIVPEAKPERLAGSEFTTHCERPESREEIFCGFIQPVEVQSKEKRKMLKAL